LDEIDTELVYSNKNKVNYHNRLLCLGIWSDSVCEDAKGCCS
jgi:hypothetical protein